VESPLESIEINGLLSSLWEPPCVVCCVLCVVCCVLCAVCCVLTLKIIPGGRGATSCPERCARKLGRAKPFPRRCALPPGFANLINRTLLHAWVPRISLVFECIPGRLAEANCPERPSQSKRIRATCRSALGIQKFVEAHCQKRTRNSRVSQRALSVMAHAIGISQENSGVVWTCDGGPL
jgi:hypothetical protein